MILFFGTRPGKTKTEQVANVPCPHCEQMGTLTMYSLHNYFHLFWIKLFKISTTVTAECNHCKKIYYKTEFTEPMLKALEE
ncbi:zinc-ribbon domain-containing protein [Maribacter aestuarii]|uniref:zinc-ribbon domain-containing protein n=1 Tax=Maribacter aestuarii TaxID=1130723 RepID=UPI0025A5EF7B|nr:zinc-ribbon domain-containing protein [Maribacter aestuarii]